MRIFVSSSLFFFFIGRDPTPPHFSRDSLFVFGSWRKSLGESFAVPFPWSCHYSSLFLILYRLKSPLFLSPTYLLFFFSFFFSWWCVFPGTQRLRRFLMLLILQIVISLYDFPEFFSQGRRYSVPKCAPQHTSFPQ